MKIKIKVMSFPESCGRCMFTHTALNHEPCLSCMDYSNFKNAKSCDLCKNSMKETFNGQCYHCTNFSNFVGEK